MIVPLTDESLVVFSSFELTRVRGYPNTAKLVIKDQRFLLRKEADGFSLTAGRDGQKISRSELPEIVKHLSGVIKK